MARTKPRWSGSGYINGHGDICTSPPHTPHGSTRSNAGSHCLPKGRSCGDHTAASRDWKMPSGSSSPSTTCNQNPSTDQIRRSASIARFATASHPGFSSIRQEYKKSMTQETSVADKSTAHLIRIAHISPIRSSTAARYGQGERTHCR